MTSIVDPKFYPAFGALVYSYATVEVGIKACVAGLMKTDMHTAFICTAPYTATNLANVAKSLADEFLKPEPAQELMALVGRWQSHTELRTFVAHHRWRAGTRPNSIRPTYWDVRSGTVRIKGFKPEERDFTVEEIFASASELSDINEAVKAFLEKTGVMALIERKNTEL